MGSVKVDLHGKEKDFKMLSLSDTNVVKWLIMFRDKRDMYFESESNSFFDEAGDVQQVNQELICLYATLDVLIEKCRFTEEQQSLIHLLSIGYDFKDLEYYKENTTSQNLKRRFNSICKKIAKENDKSWKIWIHSYHMDTIFKTCNICGESYPLTSDFYSPNKQGKDGFRNICKNCR